MGSTLKTIIALTITFNYLLICHVRCVEFNRNFTGVTFSHYVFNTAGTLYTLPTIDVIKTMMKVISTKFSRISTLEPSRIEHYQDNLTLFNSYSEVFTAEAAALLNRDANMTKTRPIFSVYNGIFLNLDSDAMKNLIEKAFETVRKANTIHPGTSLGLIISHKYVAHNLTIATLALSLAKQLKEEAKLLNLKIGIRTSCEGYKNILDTPEMLLNPLAKTRKQFLLHFNLLICLNYVNESKPLGVTTAITSVTKDLVQIRDSIHIINPNIEFAVQTRTSSPGSTERNYKYLLDFWSMMDEWGTKNNIFIWMQEAFDNPWKAEPYGPSRANIGWWKLKNGLPLTDVNAYEEKVAQLLVNSNSKTTSMDRFPVEQHTSPSKTSISTSSYVQFTTKPQLELTKLKTNKVELGNLFSTTSSQITLAEKVTVKQNIQSQKKNSTTYAQPDTTPIPPTFPDERGTNAWVYVGGILGPTIALLALALLVANWKRTNSIRRKVLTRKEIKAFVCGILKHGDLTSKSTTIEMHALQQPYNKTIEKPKNHFQIIFSSILGTGEFGIVYKAHMITESNSKAVLVALKTTKEDCTKSAVMSILSEIKILQHLGRHDNLVSLQGAYTAEIAKGVVYVAIEFCELGSLKAFLRKIPKNDDALDESLHLYQNSTGSVSKINFNELVQWSYEIACGMKYLAAKNVIHADLATRNVLLTADKTAKITDFGLSRRLYEYASYVKKQQEPLPWRWMAIETLKKLEFSCQSDVWSYGVTLWEIFAMGDVPYPGLSWTLEFVDSLETGLRMKCPGLASPEIYAIMSSCWENEPQNRPTFTQLKKSFARMLESSRNDSDGLEH